MLECKIHCKDSLDLQTIGLDVFHARTSHKQVFLWFKFRKSWSRITEQLWKPVWYTNVFACQFCVVGVVHCNHFDTMWKAVVYHQKRIIAICVHLRLFLTKVKLCIPSWRISLKYLLLCIFPLFKLVMFNGIS